MNLVFKVAAMAALLGGCTQPALTREQMIAQKKGAIVYFVDTNRGRSCKEIVTLGRFDASVNGYREYSTGYILWGATGSAGDRERPGIAYLPAGHYGIISVICDNGYTTSYKSRSRKVRLGLFDEMWPDAIAVFDVKPGEYVNIGQLTAAGAGPSEISAISDIPQQKMQLFKQLHPDFADKIVTRLMKRLPLRQPSGERTDSCVLSDLVGPKNEVEGF